MKPGPGVHVEQVRKGVMDESYARVRRVDPAIFYRYRVRALTAAHAIERNLQARSPLRVLDLGSADGGTLLEMERALPAGTGFTGIEYAAGMVALANGQSPNIHVLQGDMAALPAAIRDASFDAATALASLEHLEDPSVALTEAARALKRGGLMVATCPEPFWDRLATRLGLLEDHHESSVSERRMAGWMRQAGLDIIEYRRFMWAPVAFLPYLRIAVSPALSIAWDAIVGRLRIFDWAFINQLWVARKS